MENTKYKDRWIAGIAALTLILIGIGFLFYWPGSDDIEFSPVPQEEQQHSDEHTTQETEKPAPSGDFENESASSVGDMAIAENTLASLLPMPAEQQTEGSEPQEVTQSPRRVADSAATALDAFAAAMRENNVERALSYFAPRVREQYRESFMQWNSPAAHPVVQAYYSGTVDPVELIDPDFGLYEIAVYPRGSQLPFRLNFAYSSEVGEYVILEL